VKLSFVIQHSYPSQSTSPCIACMSPTVQPISASYFSGSGHRPRPKMVLQDVTAFATDSNLRPHISFLRARNSQKSPTFYIMTTQNRKPQNLRMKSSIHAALRLWHISPILPIWPSAISDCFQPSKKICAAAGSSQARKRLCPAILSSGGSQKPSLLKVWSGNGLKCGRHAYNTRDDTFRRIRRSNNE